MAVDTANKRFSLLGFSQGRGFPYVLPIPDNSFNAGDRYQLVHLYQGISLDAPTGTPAGSGSTYSPGGVGTPVKRWRRRGAW